MLLNGSSQFEDCLKSVEAFWSEKVNYASDWSVFVDSMHDNMDYIFFNYHLAKNIQARHGCRLVSASKYWETPFIKYNPAANEKIAQAFGADSYFNFDTLNRVTDNNIETDLAVFNENFSKSGLPLHAWIFGNNDQFVLEHHYLLRIAYDQHLRTTLKPTETDFSDEFHSTLRDCLVFSDIAKKLVKKASIRVAVLGHVEYNPYFFIAEEVLKAGGVVLFHWPLVFGSVRIFRSPEDLYTLKSVNFKTEYKEKYLSKLDSLQDSISEYSNGLLDRLTQSRNYGNFNHYHVELSREQFFESAGVSKPREKSIVLLSHALTDAVHGNGPMLFDDFSVWLDETIQQYIEHEDVNILVKVHPKDVTYVRDSWIAELAERYNGVSNFGIVSKHVNNREVAKFCDVASTVQGTPGYELPLIGLKTVIAGESRYSGLGICPVCKSKADYFAQLELACGTPTLDSEIKNNAINFAYYENIYTKLSTKFIPGMSQLKLDTPHWKGLSSVFSSELITLDPVYRALAENDIFAHDGASFLKNPILG